MDYEKLKALGFEPIKYSDESIFRFFFQKFRYNKCYSSSWLYITQAARGMGGLGYYFHYNKNFIVALGYHHEHFVLIHPIGKIPKKFINIIKKLCDISGNPVYLKKVSKENNEKIKRLIKGTNLQLIRTEKKRKEEEYPWHIDEKNDDDTFPEIIINIPGILKIESNLELTNKKIRNIKSKLKHCKRFTSSISYQPVSKTNKSEVIEMLKDHFGKDNKNFEAYLNMLEVLSRDQNNENYIHFVAKYKERYIGFFVAEILDNCSAGLYASISSRDFKGLGETLHFEIFKRLKKKGIKFINLGGSEIKSLHDFKKKFTCDKIDIYEKNEIPIIVLKKKRFLYFMWNWIVTLTSYIKKHYL